MKQTQNHIFFILFLVLLPLIVATESSSGIRTKSLYINNQFKILPPNRKVLLENEYISIYKISQFYHSAEGISYSLHTDYYLAEQFLIKRIKLPNNKDCKEVDMISGESGEACQFYKYYFFPSKKEKKSFLLLAVSFLYQAGTVIDNKSKEGFREYTNIDDLEYHFYKNDSVKSYKLKLINNIPEDFDFNHSYQNELDKVLINYALFKEGKADLLKTVKKPESFKEDCLKKKQLADVYSCVNKKLNFGLRDHYIPYLVWDHIQRSK